MPYYYHLARVWTLDKDFLQNYANLSNLSLPQEAKTHQKVIFRFFSFSVTNAVVLSYFRHL